MTNDKPICVLGILNTQRGVQIATSMEEWLCPIYQVYEVLHDGSQFELPALLRAKELALETKRPVLYIHTRGAVNEYWTTPKTHTMWRHEFGAQWRKYQMIAAQYYPTVVAPMVDNKRTRYNGFVANASAWERIDLHPVEDRHVYEDLWSEDELTSVIGTLIHKERFALQEIHNYLKRNY